MGLDDHVDADFGIGENGKGFAGKARVRRGTQNRDTGLVAGIGDTRHDTTLGDIAVGDDIGATALAGGKKAGQDPHRHMARLRELD